MQFHRLRSQLGLFAAVIVSAAAAVAVGRYRFDRATRRLVESVSDAAAPSTREFAKSDVEDLPDPVRRYFETVLTEGQPYVSTASLEQRGTFRIGGAATSTDETERRPTASPNGPRRANEAQSVSLPPWRRLRARQRFSVSPPGFVWDAKIRLAPFVSVRVVDSYADGAGSLRARLLSAVPVADAEPSPELNAGELSRYLAEAVWFPTALLPASGVSWRPVDDATARAELEHEGTTVSLLFHFDEENRVKRVTAEDRYRAVDGGFEPTPWTGRFRNYEERNGMSVPTEAAVSWTLPEGDLPYWRASIENVEHRPTG